MMETPTADQPLQAETFIERIIEASARNKFLVVIFTIFGDRGRHLGAARRRRWMPFPTSATCR